LRGAAGGIIGESFSGHRRGASTNASADHLGLFRAASGEVIFPDESGDFLEDAINLLAFGPSQVGKNHGACPLGHTLIEWGHSMLFRPAYQLVQELLAANRDLALPASCAGLDAAKPHAAAGGGKNKELQ
jgi:hypothetical protein